MDVRATLRGYYGGKVREPGDRFEIKSAAEFSKSWMEKAAPDPLDHDGDGKKGGSLPSGKPKAAERIAMARELTGRDDITTAKEADEILAAAEAETDPAPFSDDAPIEAVED